MLSSRRKLSGQDIDAKRDPKNPRRWVNLKGSGGVVPDYEVPLSKAHEDALLDQIQSELREVPLDRPKVSDPQLEKALEVLGGTK